MESPDEKILNETQKIEDNPEISQFIVFKSCFASCYFSKESCIIVLYRVKNKKSFFGAPPPQQPQFATLMLDA